MFVKSADIFIFSGRNGRKGLEFSGKFVEENVVLTPSLDLSNPTMSL